MLQKYSKILANKLKFVKYDQLGANKGLIISSSYGPIKNGLIHSEPKCDVPRIFISILPGSEIEIKKLKK
jgi:hypothetical protein